MSQNPSGNNSFLVFFERVRTGDPIAAEELVRMYEPEIRREIRLRLRDARLRSNIDPGDICQSVMASFFVRASLGQFEINNPEELIRHLLAMTRNKLVSRVRKQPKQGLDLDHREAEGQDKPKVANGSPPSLLMTNEALLQEFRNRMSPEECRIADRRTQGIHWHVIAAEVGGMSDDCRRQLSRAMNRISEELGLEEVRHE
jgi:RNA polymerase sigma-70 factor (ECF subfamily)